MIDNYISFSEYPLDEFGTGKHIASYYTEAFIPNVGDTVSIRTSRDDNGDYVHAMDDFGRPGRFLGSFVVVTRDFCFSEMGVDAQDNRKSLSVELLCKRIKDEKIYGRR